MRIFHIVPGYYPHNAAPYEYSRRLASLGNEVEVIAYRRHNQPQFEMLNGVSVTRVDIQTQQRFNPGRALQFVRAISSYIDGKTYDLVHVYGFRGCASLPLMNRRGIGRWVYDIRTGNVSTSGFRSRLADLTTRLENSVYDGHIALTYDVGRRLLGSRRQFHVVPLGADFEKFRCGDRGHLRQMLNLPQDAMIAIFSSNLNPARKPMQVLKAFALAKQEAPQLHLLIVGTGDVEEEMRNMCRHMSLDSSVHFTGYVPYDTVHHYVQAANIGLAYIPAVRQYMLQPPLKTVEYLATGLPTVASDTQGNRTFVQDGVNGVIAGDSAEEFGRALADLAHNEQLYHRMHTVARSTVTEYDWKVIVRNQLLPAYSQILSGEGSA